MNYSKGNGGRACRMYPQLPDTSWALPALDGAVIKVLVPAALELLPVPLAESVSLAEQSVQQHVGLLPSGKSPAHWSFAWPHLLKR